MILATTTLADLVANYKQSNIGQFAQDFVSQGCYDSNAGRPRLLPALKSDMAYVDANGERPGYAALDSAATIIATVKNGLIAAGHDAALVDDAFGNGLPPQPNLTRIPRRKTSATNGLGTGDLQLHLYGLQTISRRFFAVALYELALAYSPMAATRAAYRAATEVYYGKYQLRRHA